MLTKSRLLFFLLLLTSALTFTLTSCSNNPTDAPIKPPPPNEPDSTTQNFTFETFEFGSGGSSSSFNDVWVFDENNIWAVGWVDVTSTTGHTNIVRWDGSKWGGFGRQFDSDGIEGIWAADTSHIYFSDGIVLKYENGVFNWENFNNVPYSNFQRLTKIWGSSISNIYSVGRNGIIVHYDGVKWTKIDFDTQWLFYHITGNPRTGTGYAVARNINFTTIIVELKGENANVIYNSKTANISIQAFVLTMVDNNNIFFCSTKIGQFNVTTKKSELLYTLPTGYGMELATNYGANDVYFFGETISDGEKLVHYNGKRFSIISLSNRMNTIYGGASAIKDLAVMVGFSNNKAYLVKAKRK